MAQSNIILYGDVIGNSGSNTVYSITGISPTSTVPVSAATLQWLATTASPTLGQFTNAYTTGQNLTIQAQGSTFTSANGGNLLLSSGTSSGTVGNVQLQLGNTTGLTLLFTGILQFGSAITAGITQAAATTSGTDLNIAAQTAGASTNNGGSLLLTSGGSTTTGASGSITISTGTIDSGGTAGSILFEISGTAQAFISSSGLGIGSTPGTSPVITAGSGTPTATLPNGSLYANTSATTTGLYTRQNGSWSSIFQTNSSTQPIATIVAPVTEVTITNTAQVYTVDTSGGGPDGIILHNHTGSRTTYILPAPTAGRIITIRDITGAIETANTGGYVTGTGTTSNTIFVAPHATEKFNTSSGYTLSGTNTFIVTNGSSTVTATGSKFTTELAPGMSITFSEQSGVSYIVQSITSDTQLTLTSNYTGTTTNGSNITSTATMNSLAYYANYGTLTLYSNGTDWFASSNKPLRAYITGSSGTFFISPGITSMFLTGSGGGGGGGGGTANVGGGGGGGTIQSTTNISVTPNTSYPVSIGAGGTAGATGTNGGTGSNTFISTTTSQSNAIAIFYGASGGSFASTSAAYACGGYSFATGTSIGGSTNIYSSVTYAGTGSTNVANASTVTSNNLAGSFSMGGTGSPSGQAAFAGFINTTGNGTYAGGAAGTGNNAGGGGGAGPQNNGAAGGASGSGGSSAAANSGAGGGGGGAGSTSGGAGGSGYLYLLMYM
jgi:hypothetical protein